MTFEAQLFIRQRDRMRAGLHVLFLSVSSSSSCAAGRSSSSSIRPLLLLLLLLTFFLLFALHIVKELILDDVSWMRNRFLSPVTADSLDCFLFFPSFSVFFFFSGSWICCCFFLFSYPSIAICSYSLLRACYRICWISNSDFVLCSPFLIIS